MFGETLKKLRDLGNTLIVVEHDEDTIRAADHIVDIGPGAGVLGGHIMAAGTPEEVMKNPNSLTGKYLSGKEKIEVPKKRRKGNGKFLEVKWMVIVGSIIFWIYFLSVIYLIWTNRKEVGQLKLALKKYSGDLYVLALPILLLLVELVMVVLK